MYACATFIYRGMRQPHMSRCGALEHWIFAQSAEQRERERERDGERQGNEAIKIQEDLCLLWEQPRKEEQLQGCCYRAWKRIGNYIMAVYIFLMDSSFCFSSSSSSYFHLLFLEKKAVFFQGIFCKSNQELFKVSCS